MRIDFLVGCIIDFVARLVVVDFLDLLILLFVVGGKLIGIISVGVVSVGSLLGELEGEVVAECGMVVIGRSGGAIIGVGEGIISVVLKLSSRSSVIDS